MLKIRYEKRKTMLINQLLANHKRQYILKISNITSKNISKKKN